MARVLIPLPARDFDPSEAAVSWRVLVSGGHTVRFATPDGRPAIADDMMLTGKGLDPWGAVPLLRNWPLIGLLMRANRDARRAYAEMLADPNYLAPLRWDAVDSSGFDALLLPARSISPRTGRSVLHGYQTTALTWAFENSAWSVARLTRFWDPHYYRTYLEQDGQ